MRLSAQTGTAGVRPNARAAPTPRLRAAGTRALGRVRRAATRAREIPQPLALLLLLGAALSIAWDVSLPAFQGPDESAHFSYVQHLAETGKPPSSTGGVNPNSGEVQNALIALNLRSTIGNLGSRPAWDSVDMSRWREIERSLPRGSRASGSGPNPIAKNPPLYYALMAIPYRIFVWLPLLQRLFVLRLFNALCYLLTIALTWLIAGEVFGASRWKQTLAAGAVALEPQLSFMSAVINADNLLILTVTGFLLSALRLVKRGPSLRRVLACSALAAAAILTHGRGLVTLPVLAVALAGATIRFRPTARETAIRLAAAAATVGGALVAYLLAAKASGGGSLYGGQVSELNNGGFNLRQFLSSIYQFYFPRLRSLRPRLGPEYGYRQVFIETFYGTFGSLEVQFKAGIYDALQVFSAIGLGGLYTACVVRRATLLRAWPVVAVLLSLAVTNVLFLHYVSYRALLDDAGSDPLIVGRYLLPMISLFSLAIVFTVSALPRRAAQLLGAAILAAGVLLSLTGVGMTAARFYA